MKKNRKRLFMILPLLFCTLSSCRPWRETAYHAVLYYESHNAVKGRLVYDTANVRFVFYSSEEDRHFAGYLICRSSFHIKDYEYLFPDEEGYIDRAQEYAKLDCCYADVLRTRGANKKNFDVPFEYDPSYLNGIITHLYTEKMPDSFYEDGRYQRVVQGRHQV